MNEGIDDIQVQMDEVLESLKEAASTLGILKSRRASSVRSAGDVITILDQISLIEVYMDNLLIEVKSLEAQQLIAKIQHTNLIK